MMRWATALLAVITSLSSTAQAADHDWQAGLSLSYSTGDYGEPEDTDLLYIPVTLKRYMDRGTISITVPYLDLSGDGSATVIDGTVQAVEPGDEPATGSGLGDIIVRGLLEVKDQEGAWPFIDLTAKLKLPTGDDDKGLGTGEADLGFGLELTRVLDQGYYLLSELGYTFIGEPSGSDFDNRWNYALGAGRQMSKQLQLTAMLDGRTALSSDNDNPLSILFFGTWKQRQHLLFDGMLEFGLNDGSPEFGITAAVRQRW